MKQGEEVGKMSLAAQMRNDGGEREVLDRRRSIVESMSLPMTGTRIENPVPLGVNSACYG